MTREEAIDEGIEAIEAEVIAATQELWEGGHHRCDGPKDAHHLIPKQFIRQRLSDWPEDKLLAVLFNPLIGAPLCRGAHDAIERGSERIYWEDLTEEALEYVSGLPDFMLLRLEGECPKREQGAAA